ncbi:MAG: hypothetical protein AAFU71_10475, partial [Cyanobacteria bacterium J06632_22]
QCHRSRQKSQITPHHREPQVGERTSPKPQTVCSDYASCTDARGTMVVRPALSAQLGTSDHGIA